MTNTITTELTHERAIELAKEVIRLQTVIDQMKKQIKEYVEKHGELVADGVVWKFQEVESWDFDDSAKTKEFLKSIVIDGYTTDPFSVVSISKKELDKLGLDEQYISKFAKKKVSKRFVNRKI